MSSSDIPEPDEGTIVAWFDAADDLYAVFHRTDAHKEWVGDQDVWYNADQFDTNDDSPMTWRELLAEMDDFRGPITLLAQQGLSTGGEVRRDR